MKSVLKYLVIVGLVVPGLSIPAMPKEKGRLPTQSGVSVKERSLSPLYAQVGMGYAYTYYKQLVSIAAVTETRHMSNGISSSVDLGYSLYPHAAFEVGASKFPKGISNTAQHPADVTSWHLHVAGRFDAAVPSLPVNVYLKGGAAYRSIDLDNIVQPAKVHYWAPFVSGGVMYNFNKMIYSALEYAYVGDDYHHFLSRDIPGVSALSLKLGVRIPRW